MFHLNRSQLLRLYSILLQEWIRLTWGNRVAEVNKSSWWETCPSPTMSTTNTTRKAVKSNPNLHWWKPPNGQTGSAVPLICLYIQICTLVTPTHINTIYMYLIIYLLFSKKLCFEQHFGGQFFTLPLLLRLKNVCRWALSCLLRTPLDIS
jgi:hypothetical protein